MWDRGASYESYIGSWSRLVARQFVPWLEVSSGAKWLDVGCGTGNVIQAILDIGQALSVESASYDAAVSGLMLNFVPQPSQALREMIRAVRVGGTVAAYVWDYAGQMQLIRYFWDAAIELDRAQASILDEGQRFPLCQPEPLRQLFQTVTI